MTSPRIASLSPSTALQHTAVYPRFSISIGKQIYSLPFSVRSENFSVSKSSRVMPSSSSVLYFDSPFVLCRMAEPSSPAESGSDRIMKSSMSLTDSTVSARVSADKCDLIYASYSSTDVHLTKYQSPPIRPLVRSTWFCASSVSEPESPAISVPVCSYSVVTISAVSAGKRPAASGGSSTFPLLTRTTILFPPKRSPVNSPSAICGWSLMAASLTRAFSSSQKPLPTSSAVLPYPSIIPRTDSVLFTLSAMISSL